MTKRANASHHDRRQLQLFQQDRPASNKNETNQPEYLSQALRAGRPVVSGDTAV